MKKFAAADNATDCLCLLSQTGAHTSKNKKGGTPKLRTGEGTTSQAACSVCVGLPQVCTQRRRRSDRRSLVRPSLPSPLLNHGEGAPNLILPSSSPKKMLPATTTEGDDVRRGRASSGFGFGLPNPIPSSVLLLPPPVPLLKTPADQRKPVSTTRP